MRYKIFLLALLPLIISSCGISNTISVCTYRDGYWDGWDEIGTLKWSYRGKPDNFIVYNSFFHPSEYTFKLEIQGMPIKDNNKADIKSNKWYSYNGIIYYDQNVDFKKLGPSLKAYLNPHFNNVQKKQVTVKVMKKSSGYVYNVISGNEGFGITIPWQYSKKIK